MSTLIHACCCPYCHQTLEYGDDYRNQVIDCPACQKEMTLPDTPFPMPQQESVIGKFFNSIRNKAEGVRDKRKLKGMLVDAVADGFLTDDEIGQIQAFMAEVDLHPAETEEWSQELFQKAAKSLNSRNLSENASTRLIISNNTSAFLIKL